MKTKFLRLGFRDFLKGLVLALITAVITFLTNELAANSTIDAELFKRIGITALIAFLSYLVKNLFTNNADELLKPDK
jgi:hypothetical protein